MRALAAALALVPSLAWGFVGSFPVCEPAPQYARVEVVRGHGVPDCIAAGMAAGDPRPLLMLLVGLPVPVCTVAAGERATIYATPEVTDDSILGHELRHAFPPVHSHPYALPWLSSDC